MKEMNWTRDEALKRLAFVYQDTDHAMERQASKAAGAPSKRVREMMFEESVEKSNIAAGIIMAASALGIEFEEIVGLEFDRDEKHDFMKEFADYVEGKARETRKDFIRKDMPDFLADLLG